MISQTKRSWRDLCSHYKAGNVPELNLSVQQIKNSKLKLLSDLEILNLRMRRDRKDEREERTVKPRYQTPKFFIQIFACVSLKSTFIENKTECVVEDL